MSAEADDPRSALARPSPFDQLLALIENGELHPGRRLRETELAERLGISRTPVREALHRLHAMGLAQQGPRRGLIITQISYDRLRQLFEVREGLEGMATRLAASHASGAEIALLHDMVAEDRRTTDGTRLAQRNKLLHRQIVQASHNSYMIEALRNLSVHLGLLSGSTYDEPGRLSAAQTEHEEIVEAIAARDGARAERAARRHIVEGLAIRLRMLARTA
ncbi:GntR family transcriptional regulator [Paracoccus pacificus]|uniref:GntR family transcriptional regulator n=1 Tax=Paracoccus pacificus TaxID=1463598 RepID=A0ABW4RAM1_9RHOB